MSTLQSPVDCVIIARCSVAEGYGHFNRALSLYLELKKIGVGVKFALLGDLTPHDTYLLDPPDWEHFETDRSAVTFVQKFQARIVIFDCLTFDQEGFTSINEVANTVSLSPVFDQLDRVNVIIHRSRVTPKEWQAFPRTQQIFGELDYSIVSPHVPRVSVEDFRSRIKESPLHLGVSMGGTDPKNDTSLVLEALGSFNRQIVTWVALGPGYKFSIDELVETAERSSSEIILLRSNESLWRIFRNVCLVITAGGITTYEAAMAGIPSVTIMKDPQKSFLALELSKSKATRILDQKTVLQGDLGKFLSGVLRDPETLLGMRNDSLGNKLSQGAKKVAELIARQLSESPESSAEGI